MAIASQLRLHHARGASALRITSPSANAAAAAMALAARVRRKGWRGTGVATFPVTVSTQY
eukprot:3668644-Rhodomonas_salina.5